MKNNPLTPSLHFPNFSDDWEEKRLGDIAEKYIGGGTPSTKEPKFWENGNIPWIQSSDIDKEKVINVTIQKNITEQALKNSSAKIIPKNSIAVVTRVGVGKVALMNEIYSTSQDFLSFVNLKENEKFWVYKIKQLMERQSLYLQGTSIKGITKDELLKVNTLSPSLPDQEKIGQFLSLVDKKIELEENKLELLKERKKGWLQKLFNQDIRFKDENGNDYPAWSKNEIKNIVSSLPTKKYIVATDNITSNELDFPVYQQGLQPLYNYAIQEPFKDYVNVILFGDHTLSLYSPKKEFLLATDEVKLLMFDNFNTSFSYYMLQYFMPKSQGYKRHFSILKEVVVSYPSLPEQEKIAGFLSKQDELIEVQEKKVELLKQQKKGLLQKMFV